MVTTVLLSMLAATPLKVAAMQLNFVDVSAPRGDFYTAHLVDRLTDQGLIVTSQREVSSVLGLERQRQLMGCTEDSSCLAEIAAALGVDGILIGDVAHVGSIFQANLKIIDPKSSKRLASFSSAAKSEEELLSVLNKAAVQLAQQFSVSLGRVPAPPGQVEAAAPVEVAKPAVGGGSRRWWWVPGLVGVLVGAGGGLSLARAEALRVDLLRPDLGSSPATTYELGLTFRAIGWVGTGVGLAALGTAAALLIFGSDAPVTPIATFSGNGLGFAVQGSFR